MPTSEPETLTYLASVAGYRSAQEMWEALSTRGTTDQQALLLILGLMKEIATLNERLATAMERVEQLTTAVDSLTELENKRSGLLSRTTESTTGPETS